ncbi:MAG: NADP-dependent isocitrate dehydrogenase, partial [Planctomycetota bacterium]
MADQPTIVYTKTDEAPALATHSLLPIVRAFVEPAGIAVELSDISLAGRVIAQFPERLTEAQRQPDALAQLGELAKTPGANIVKLPNISASIPQLTACIKELQAQGYDLPDYPADPTTDAETEIKARYAKVLGSAVNPVLREGNSDRRVAPPVKAYAQANPHSMGAWSSDSKSHVAHMDGGDFFGSEQSHTCADATTVKIVLEHAGGTSTLKEGLELLAGEVIDAATMSVKKLRAFLADQVADAKQSGVLFSLHMKATMMKVSDPIIFGHCVEVFFAELFEKHADMFAKLGVNPRNGFGDVVAKIADLPAEERETIEADLAALYEEQPPLAMVDSDRGITNLHVPSDVIIDASMPAMIRNSGQMWGPDGKSADTKAVIPDRSYAGVYAATIDFCKANGAFDPATMGSVSNVGLMAKKAEEYGSHDKTFEMPADGAVKVIAGDGTVVFEHAVEAGDLWRMCQTKDVAIKDWIKLAVSRARATGAPAVFWLNEARAHDAELIKKVHAYLPEHDTSGLEIKILPPVEATQLSLERCKAGQDTISVTGNVLRDYLTDLFPILELGTSAKMLSIVPLLNGGGLYETGAGGSAPKHVQQFVGEGHLRWDSLGEFLALAVSIGDAAEKAGSAAGKVVAEALDAATGKLLDTHKSPGRKVGQLDNRGSHYWLARYWAEALAAQNDDAALKAKFASLADALATHEATILEELGATEGQAIDLGGYYRPDDAKASVAMRPSAAFNAA